MEHVLVLRHHAIAVARVDFHDPALADDPTPRERGVRVEIRPVSEEYAGSLYSSSTLRAEPATTRIDLLESRPGAADRMHWHPVMHDGEPGDRTFDPALSADPVGWLRTHLLGLTDDDLAPYVDEVLALVESGLVWARSSWPEHVERDERGMASVPM